MSSITQSVSDEIRLQQANNILPLYDDQRYGAYVNEFKEYLLSGLINSKKTNPLLLKAFAKGFIAARKVDSEKNAVLLFNLYVNNVKNNHDLEDYSFSSSFLISEEIPGKSEKEQIEIRQALFLLCDEDFTPEDFSKYDMAEEGETIYDEYLFWFIFQLRNYPEEAHAVFGSSAEINKHIFPGLGLRLWGAFLDLGGMRNYMFLIGLSVAFINYLMGKPIESLSEGHRILFCIILITTIFLLYYAQETGGQTNGRSRTNTIVLDKNGELPSLLLSIKRTLFRFSLIIIASILVAISDLPEELIGAAFLLTVFLYLVSIVVSRRALHDRYTNTFVVQFSGSDNDESENEEVESSENSVSENA